MNYKKYIFLTLNLIFAFFGGKAQTINCHKFKKGTYKMTYNGYSTLIKRDSLYQYEYYNNLKQPFIFKINWISDCIYTLKPNNSSYKVFDNLPKNALITVQIVSSYKNSYKIKATSNFNNTVIESTITKLN